MKKLLSCPFCGSAAEIVDEMLPLTNRHHINIPSLQTMPAVASSMVDMPLFSTKAEAIKKWNSQAEMQHHLQFKSAKH